MVCTLLRDPVCNTIHPWTVLYNDSWLDRNLLVRQQGKEPLSLYSPCQKSVDMTERPLLPLPPGVKPLRHQTAGHFYGKGTTKLGFLETLEDGTLLKPVEASKRGQREVNFYQRLFDPSISDPVLLMLQSLVPNYLGIWTIPTHPGVNYLKLEDITRKFSRPNILDLKMGAITYEPGAGDKKILHEQDKYPHISKTCFQTIGMMTYRPETEDYHRYLKKYLLSLDEHDLLWKGLAEFVNYRGGLHRPVVKEFLSKLQGIRDWFQTQKQLSFFASSLLLVYDAMDTRPSGINLNHPTKASPDNKGYKDGCACKPNPDVVKTSEMQKLCCDRKSPALSSESAMDTSSAFRIINGPLCKDMGPEAVDSCFRCDACNSRNLIVAPSNECSCDKTEGVVINDSSLALNQPIPRRNSENISQRIANTSKSDFSLPTQETTTTPLVDVRMIDFVRVYPTYDTDQNYLDGLDNLISYLQKLL